MGESERRYAEAIKFLERSAEVIAENEQENARVRMNDAFRASLDDGSLHLQVKHALIFGTSYSDAKATAENLGIAHDQWELFNVPRALANHGANSRTLNYYRVHVLTDRAAKLDGSLDLLHRYWHTIVELEQDARPPAWLSKRNAA